MLLVRGAESLAKLFSLMDQNSPERVAFVSRALKWSTGGSSKLGHPKLHQLLAVTLWKGNRPIFSFYKMQRLLKHTLITRGGTHCFDDTNIPTPCVFRAKLQRVSLSLPALVRRRGLRTDASGVFCVPRLPERG